MERDMSDPILIGGDWLEDPGSRYVPVDYQSVLATVTAGMGTRQVDYEEALLSHTESGNLLT